MSPDVSLARVLSMRVSSTLELGLVLAVLWRRTHPIRPQPKRKVRLQANRWERSQVKQQVGLLIMRVRYLATVAIVPDSGDDVSVPDEDCVRSLMTDWCRSVVLLQGGFRVLKQYAQDLRSWALQFSDSTVAGHVH